LKKLCSEGLPDSDYFNLCAKYLTDFEQILKNKDYRKKSLKELVIDDRKINDNKKNIRENTKTIIEANLKNQVFSFKNF